MDATLAESVNTTTHARAISNSDPLANQLANPAENLNSVTVTMVKILKVPEDRKSVAVAEVTRAFEWLAMSDKYSGRRRDIGKSFESIASLCDKLLLELRALDARGRDVLSMCASREESIAFQEYVDGIEEIRLSASLIRRSKKARYRPRGSIKDSHISSLIFDLYRAAEKNGGKLTLGLNTKSRMPNGTLPAALRVLHEHFPKLVPANISYQTLRRRKLSAVKRYGNGSRPKPPNPDGPEFAPWP